MAEHAGVIQGTYVTRVQSNKMRSCSELEL